MRVCVGVIWYVRVSNSTRAILGLVSRGKRMCVCPALFGLSRATLPLRLSRMILHRCMLSIPFGRRFCTRRSCLVETSCLLACVYVCARAHRCARVCMCGPLPVRVRMRACISAGLLQGSECPGCMAACAHAWFVMSDLGKVRGHSTTR